MSKKPLKESVNDWQTPENFSMKTGGSNQFGGMYTDEYGAGKQHPNSKQDGKVVPYPITLNTAEDYAQLMLKTREMKKIFKTAARNKAVSKEDKLKLEAVAERFNLIFIHFINISKELDKIGIKF